MLKVKWHVWKVNLMSPRAQAGLESFVFFAMLNEENSAQILYCQQKIII